MVEVRIRACHVHGRFVAKDNLRPDYTLREALENPQRDVNRDRAAARVLHPRKAQDRETLARGGGFHPIERSSTSVFGPADGDVGIILQGGMYNGVIRALQQLGLADAYGATRVPLYVLNVTYPLVPEEVIDFCRDKRAVLIVEEGQPEFIEQAINTMSAPRRT